MKYKFKAYDGKKKSFLNPEMEGGAMLVVVNAVADAVEKKLPDVEEAYHERIHHGKKATNVKIKHERESGQILVFPLGPRTSAQVGLTGDLVRLMEFETHALRSLSGATYKKKV